MILLVGLQLEKFWCSEMFLKKKTCINVKLKHNITVSTFCFGCLRFNHLKLMVFPSLSVPPQQRTDPKPTNQQDSSFKQQTEERHQAEFEDEECRREIKTASRRGAMRAES